MTRAPGIVAALYALAAAVAARLLPEVKVGARER